MPDTQELKLYVELTLQDMMENKSQAVFDQLASEKLEQELSLTLGEDYTYYSTTKTTKTTAFPKEDGGILIECIVEVTAKPESIKDLFQIMERLQIGI